MGDLFYKHVIILAKLYRMEIFANTRNNRNILDSNKLIKLHQDPDYDSYRLMARDCCNLYSR